jgi:putative phosphoribosyl transferase
MSRPTDPPPTVLEVSIASDGRAVRGELRVPERARGAVAFAHGSGSGRYSPRNRFVAQELRRLSLATLLIDLLEEDEARDQDKVFDVELLASRLLAGARWLRAQALTAALPLGYFGASTGAAAALWAASESPQLVAAVVSRGGRPDLAAGALARVKAPTLLIVGEKDEQVLEWNRDALKRLAGPKELVVIPGATHLFAEAGALEEAARRAGRWFTRYLGSESRE